MAVLAAVLMLFASTFFSSVFFASGKRLKQQETADLMEVQATRATPPRWPRTSDVFGGGSSGLGGDSSGGGSAGRRHSYGLAGIGRAMGSADDAAMAAVEEDALDKQTLYEDLWQPGGTTNAAKTSGRAVPKRSSPSGHSAAPSSKEFTAAFASMDTNNDGKLDMEELQLGMKELGSPMSDAELEKELEKFVKLADRNRDGMVDADEYLAGVRGRGEVSLEAFEQEAVKMIDSLIAREIKTRLPNWAPFMQKLQHEGIGGFATSAVFIAIYKQCGTHANMQSGLHERCILDDLRPLIGQEGDQKNAAGKTFLQISVEMMFAQLDRHTKAYLKTLQELKEQV